MLHVNNLPMGCAFVAEMRGGQQFVGWDQGRYMWAGMIDAINVLRYVLILCNVNPKAKTPEPPDPYPVPDVIERKELAVNPGSFAGMLIEAKRKRAGAGCTADSKDASGPSRAESRRSAIPTTGSNSEDRSSESSAPRGAAKRWKQNSR